MSNGNGRIIQSETVVKGCRDFVLLSDGKEVDPTIQVVSMTVNKKVNKVSTARIVIKDGSTCEENFSVSDGDLFTPGKKIEIRAGRGAASIVVFRGISIKLKIKASDKGAQLTVECKDECVKMTVGRQNKFYKDKTDSDVIKAILGEFGLVGNLEKSSVKHKNLAQSKTTPWEFILSRASSNGMLVVPDDGKINLIKPDDSKEPTISLVHGSTMVEFEAELDAKNQYPKVKVSAGGNSATSSSSTLGELGNMAGKFLSSVLGLKEFEIRHGADMPKQELQAWADSTMLKSRLSKIKGRAQFGGLANVKPGDVVGLDGVGARFAGKAFVASTQQVFEPSGWKTTAEFGLEQKDWGGGGGGGAVPGDSGGSGLLSKIVDAVSELLKPAKGLRIGKVISLSGADVMVKVPIIGPIAKGFRAKHAVLDAGAGRGTYFPLKPGDEVVVGFINQDPRKPVVLGGLFKGAPPLYTGMAREYKGIVTDKKLRFVLDDTNKTIVVGTPGGNIIELNDKKNTITLRDEKANGNRIVMHKDGILIQSKKDITLSANGKIIIDAKKKISVNSEANLEAKSKTKMLLEGKAGMDLSSGSKMRVKGSEFHQQPPGAVKKPKKEKIKAIPPRLDSEGRGLIR